MSNLAIDSSTHREDYGKVIEPDYDERIRVLNKALEEVQKPDNLRRRSGRNLLAHAQLILDVLDEIHDLHPFIGVATVPFKATLKILLARQETDKRVAVLTVEMIDMMSVFVELRHINVPVRMTPSGEAVHPNLLSILEAIKYDIEGFGNVIDCYTKANSINRALRSREWANNFRDFTERFQKRKLDLLRGLSLHATHAMDVLHSKVDQVLSVLTELFNQPASVTERSLLKLVDRERGRLNIKDEDGGNQKFLDSEDAFEAIYKACHTEEWDRNLGSGPKGMEKEKESRSKEEERARKAKFKEQWEESKRPLADVIEENFLVFKLLLQAQKEDFMSRIRQAETKIIGALNDGPHSRIKHHVIRNLWKEMHWRLSVKTRHFVMTLHDHSRQWLTYGTPAQGAGSDSVSDSSGTEGATALVDPTDDWCLQYLRLQHLPAISEAFDDDGSGFIKISEVNDFTDGLPKDWTLLQWVSYWAAGWPAETWKYAKNIQQTLIRIAEAQLHVKPENAETVNNYMNHIALCEVQLVISSIRRPVLELEPQLSRLASSHALETEKALGKALETVKYNIDQPDTLPVLIGSGRIEKYLLPLLHLILLRHLKIVIVARAEILDSREMPAAQQSLSNVLEKVRQRVAEMEESFIQQKVDPCEQFKRFAGGMYFQHFLRSESDRYRDIGLTPQHPSDNNEDSDAESEPPSPDAWYNVEDTHALDLGLNTPLISPDATSCPARYNPVSPDTALYAIPSNLTAENLAWRPLGVRISAIGPRALLGLAIQRVLERVRLLKPRLTWRYLQRRRSVRLKWLEISLRSEEVYIGNWEFLRRECSTKEELDNLRLQITPGDVSYYTSLANLEARRQIRHTAYCDGCYSQIFGKWFHCVNCSEFNLCNDCEHAETPNHDLQMHPPEHTMMQINCPMPYPDVDVFEKRATAYLAQHAESRCPCFDVRGSLLMEKIFTDTTESDDNAALRCYGCQELIRNEMHFRCLQCRVTCDLCEKCERAGSTGHCDAHVLLKMKAPFMGQSTVPVEEVEERPGERTTGMSASLDERLTRLNTRLDKIEAKLDDRLDTVLSLLEQLSTRLTRFPGK